MEKKIILILLIIFIVFTLTSQEKVKVSKIKYLSPKVFKEKILLTYLGIRENDYYTEKKLNILIELAKLRLQFYGVFDRINIFYNESEENTSDKTVFVELTDGNRTEFLVHSYYGMLAKKNWLYRGDLIQGFFGLNKNVFITHHNMGFGWMFFEQETGWMWKMKSYYFPFFPLYGDENKYIHNVFTLGRIGFKIHPDIKLGLQAGVTANFLNEIRNREFYNETKYSFTFKRLGFPIYFFFEADQRYLRDKYYFGYKFYFSGGVNLDAFNQTTFFPLNTELSLYVVPNKYVTIKLKERLYNQLGNPLCLLKHDINYAEYQRGKILSKHTGDFIFINNIDCIVAFSHFKIKLYSISLGALFFYDGTLLADNSTILTEKYYYNTIGAGFWVRMGEPVNLSVFINFGYSILNSWQISVNIIAGQW